MLFFFKYCCKTKGRRTRNSHKVLYTADLYKHILQQGFAQTDITILSMYGEQVKRIRKQLKEMGIKSELSRLFSRPREQDNNFITCSS